MQTRRPIALALSAAVVGSLLSGAVAFAPAQAASKPGWTKNCTQLQKKYPHGVGKAKARDKVASGKKRVTNFKKSDSLYKTAMKYNKGLDRDKDGIACEKR